MTSHTVMDKIFNTNLHYSSTSFTRKFGFKNVASLTAIKLVVAYFFRQPCNFRSL